MTNVLFTAFLWLLIRFFLVRHCNYHSFLINKQMFYCIQCILITYYHITISDNFFNLCSYTTGDPGPTPTAKTLANLLSYHSSLINKLYKRIPIYFHKLCRFLYRVFYPILCYRILVFFFFSVF